MADINTIISKEALEGLTKAIDQIAKLNLGLEGLLKTAVKVDETLGKGKGLTSNTEKQKANKTAVTETEKVNKQLITTQEKIDNVYSKGNKELIKKKTELSKATKAIKDNQEATKQAAGSYNQLNAALKKDIQSLKSLSAAERENGAEGKKLKKSIDANQVALKKMDAEMGNHQRHVGDYKGQLEGLNVTLKKDERALKAMSKAERKTSEEGKRLTSSVKKTKTEIKELNKTADKSSDKFGKLKIAIIALAGAAGVKKLMGFLSGSLALFDKEIVAQKKLETALGYTSEKLLRQADALQAQTRFGNEAIVGGQAFLAQMKLTEEQIEKITPLVLDFAAGYGYEVNSAFQLVAKTIGSSTNALSRYGITVEGAVGSNERLDSALKALGSAFEGNAVAMAKVGLGPITQLNNLWGDMQERLGSFVATALNPFVKHLSKAITPAKSLTDQFKDQNDKVLELNKGLIPLIGEYKELTKKGKLSADEQARLNTLIKSIGTEVPAAITQMDEYGRIIGISADKAERFVKAQQDILKALNKDAINENKEALAKLRSEFNTTASNIEIGGRTIEEVVVRYVDGILTGTEKVGKFFKYTENEITSFKVTMGELGAEMLTIEDVIKVLSGEFDDFTGKTKKAGVETDIVKGSIGDLEKQLSDLNTEKKKILITDTAALALNERLILGIERQIELAENLGRVSIKKLDKIEGGPIETAQTTADELKEIDDETTEHILANKGRLDEADTARALEIIDLAGYVASSTLSLYQEAIGRQLESLMMQKEFELGLAEGNQEEQAKINKKFAKKEADLKRKKAIADKSAALITAAINTAVAITSATTAGPGIGLVLAAITAAFNAVQLGIIASQPIPQFAEGGRQKKSGMAWVGDAGKKELIFDPSGGISLSGDKPEMRYLRRGTKVIAGGETERLLSAAKGYDSLEVMQLEGVIREGDKGIINAIQNKRELTIIPGKSKIIDRRGRYYKTYVNAKFEQ